MSQNFQNGRKIKERMNSILIHKQANKQNKSTHKHPIMKLQNSKGKRKEKKTKNKKHQNSESERKIAYNGIKVP